MNTNLNNSSQCYIGYIEDNPVCFFAVLHFPHPKVKNIKRGHRLVVLPDYQGLGIGHKFSTHIAELYKKNNYRFRITSSTKSLFYQRVKDPKWIVTDKSRKKNHTGLGNGNSGSQNKITYTYEYIG